MRMNNRRWGAAALAIAAATAAILLATKAPLTGGSATQRTASPKPIALDAVIARIDAESGANSAPVRVAAAPLPASDPESQPRSRPTPPRGHSFVRSTTAARRSIENAVSPPDHGTKRPAWVGSPESVAALASQADGAGRPWTFGWIRLAARLDEDTTAELKRLGAEVLGGGGRSLVRARLPGSEPALRAIEALPAVAGLGAVPGPVRVPPAVHDALASSTAGRLPVFVTLMDDDRGLEYGDALEEAGAVTGRYDRRIRTWTANVDRDALGRIAGLDFVLAVESIGIVEALHDTAVPAMGADSLRRWNGPGLFSGVGGATVPIGVADTGLNASHADIRELRSSICGSNFVAGDARAQDEDLWVDASGHGTHATGTIAGNGFLSGAFAGMAPAVSHIRIAKVLDSEGGGTDDGVNRGMDWLAEASGCGGSDAVRPLVVNMSLSGSGPHWEGRSVGPRKLDAVVWDTRQLYVVAQSNEAASGFSDYASAKNSLSVGAAFDGGDVAPFSSHGPTADGRLAPLVVGTGVGVCSASGNGSASGYDCASGTSTASPAVAGVAALLMDAAPEHASQPALVRARLMAGAVRPDAWLDDPTSFPADNSDGPGRLQALYGLGKVSARTAVLNRNTADGWTGGGATAGFAEGATDYAYRDVEVPAGASRLDVVLTWDEPPVDAVVDPVLNDLDLWLDRLADCGDGPCGERASRSRNDNVEWVIVRNPEPGTWRLKIVPERTYTASRAAVAWTVVRGASTPRLAIDADHSSSADGDSLALSLSVDSYVAAGASLHFGCRGAAVDCEGLRIQVGDVPREDGLATRAGEAEDGGTDRTVPLATRIPLGEIAAGETLAINVDVAHPGSGAVRLYYTAGAWNAEGASGSVVVRPRAAAGTDAPPAVRADNDAFADAALIEGVEGSVALDLAGTAAEPGEPPASTLSQEFPGSDERRWYERPLGSVWYEWTAPADDLVTLWLASGSSGPGSETIDVFAGDDVVAATRVATSQRGKREPIVLLGFLLVGYDETISSVGSATFFAEAGGTYRVRVANSEASAPLTMRWRQGPRPANDDFAAAQALPDADGSFAGTNAGATLEAGEAFGVLAATTWHRWTAPSDGAWRFAVDRGNLHVAVLTGDGVRDARLVSGLPAEDATFRARSGQVYRVVVAAPDAFGAGSPYELTWEPAEWDPDPGDDFAVAAGLDLDAGASASLSLCTQGFFTVYDNNYTVEPGEPRETGARTRWWSWTAPETAAYTWRLGTEDGLTLSAFGGDALGSLEPAVSTGGATGREFSFAADGGRTYRISLGWPVGDAGAFTKICGFADVSVGRTPVNDERSAATGLGSTRGSTAVDELFGTTGSGELADRLGHSSLWWEWEAPTSGWYTFQAGGTGRYMAVYEGGSTTPVSRSAGADGQVTFRAVAGRRYTIRVGSPATDDGAPFSLGWHPADAPAWLGFAGSFADAPDAQGRAVRLMDVGSLAFGGADGGTLYAVSALGLTAFERDSATGALNGVRSIEDDLRGSVLVADPKRRRLIASRCGTWRVYTGLDDTTTIAGGELAVEGDPSNCGRRLFLEPGGAFLYRVVPETGIEVFAVEDGGGLRHEASTRLAGIKDAVIARNGEFVYAADLDATTHLRTFRRDRDSGLLTQLNRHRYFFQAEDMDNLAIGGDDLLFVTRRSSGLTLMYELAEGVLTPAGETVSLIDDTELPVELARPFEFTSARSETTAVDVFGASVAAGFEMRQNEIDLLANGQRDRFGNRVPLFGSPDGLAASPDGRHVYAATYDHGIVAFERIGAGVEPEDPHVRLDILTVSSGLISFGGETDSDGCIAVDGLDHEGTAYTVRSSNWQWRPNADWDWSDVAGTSAPGEVCPHTPSEPGHYRLVAEIEVDGEVGQYASDDLVQDDHGDSTDDATAVGVTSATPGWLDPDDVDYFRIELDGPGTLTVYTDGWTDTEGGLLDGDGDLIASDGDGGEEANFRISRSLEAGTYYVRVRGSSGARGDYTLHAEFEAATADLVVSSATLSATPEVGGTFTLDVVVRNDGDGGAVATTLRYYRSDDSAISASDEEIGTDEVAALGAGASAGHSIDVTVDDDGSYSYGACVDAVDGESDTVNNCSAAATEPGTEFELDAANAEPRGIAHADGVLYVVDWLDEEIYAYTTAGERRSGSDFELDEANVWPRGIAHADGVLYVVDWLDEEIYAYSTAGERRSGSDFELDEANVSPRGIAHADGVLYVVDWVDEEIYAYTTAGERRSGSDFELDAANTSPWGIAHADGLLYVVDGADDRAYAYTTSGERRADRDFELDVDNSQAQGITYAGGRFYVVDGNSNRVFVYKGDERGGGDDHGDTFATATTVSIPSSTDGEIEEGGDKDYFRLEVTEATTLTVETTGSIDTYGTLFDGDEASLETDDDGGPGTNFRIERDVRAGTHYVEVRGFDGSTRGSYELNVSASAGGE